MVKKVRFVDLPDYACFKPTPKSNPGKKLGADLVRWHGNTYADTIPQRKIKGRPDIVTRDSLVIPTRCPGERGAQPPKVQRKCRLLRQRYRQVQGYIDEELRQPARLRDRDEIRDLQKQQDNILFDAMTLDCGWVDVE